MNHPPRPWTTLVAAGLGSVAASILLPSIVISAIAAMTRDPHRTTQLAITVAEPLAVLGAAAVTGLAVARTASRRRHAWRWGALAGGVAALSIVGAALWVGDVDRWTALAAAVLPIVGIVATRWTPRHRTPAVLTGADAIPALPAPHAVEAARARDAVEDVRRR